MRFFVPGCDEDQVKSAEVWESVQRFAEQTLGWAVSSRKIYKLDYIHDQKTRLDRVGSLASGNREEVIAILESNAYLVCTANRGVLRGMPMLVGTDEVIRAEDFEGPSATGDTALTDRR